MTRRAAIIAFSLAVVLGLLGAQSWDLALDRVQRSAVAAVEEKTGFAVKNIERAEIALLPLPRISLSNVSFSQRDGAVSGTAIRLRAHLRLLPLLSGQLSFDRIDLVVPQIDVAVAPGSEGLTEWLAPPLAELERLRSQSKIVVQNGSLFLRAKDAIQSVVRDLNLVIDERSPGEPLELSGSLAWRGVPTEVSLRWPMASGNAKATLSASSSLLKLRFEGTRSGGGEPVINGLLALSSPSVPQALRWFGEDSRLASALGALTLSADLQLKPHEASFSNAIASLDGERLDGVLKLTEVAGGRFAVSGTLAGATLDIGRLVNRLPLPAVDAADTSPFDLDGWTGREIDLRVSVDAAKLNGARLSDVATYLLIKKGRFETGLLRAGAYGGSVKARLLAVSAASGVDVKVQAGLEKVNLGQAANDVPQLPRLSGNGTFQLALDGAGRNFDELLGALTGRANLSVRQGELGGVAFIDLLRRAERSPAHALRDWRQGKTPFDTLNANAGIAGGLFVLTDAEMSGPSYRLGLTGNGLLRSRILDMTASLASTTSTLKLPFTLKGPVASPLFELETEAFLSPVGGSPLPTVFTR